jgi:hypothetical protein
MDNRRTPVLLAFVVGYFFIVAVLLFLIPHLGVQIIYAVLAVWIFVVLAIALVAGRRRKEPMPKASKVSPQKMHDLLPEAIRI